MKINKLIFVFFFLFLFSLFQACSKAEGTIIETVSSEENIQDLQAFEENSEAYSSSDKKSICVSIIGCVKYPGVYTLNEGARVYELINAAGGLSEDADTDGLNLVYIMSDGMQIEIPGKENVEATDSTSISSASAEKPMLSSALDTRHEESSNVSLVNINSADVSELMTLTGIGKTRAEAIISYRTQNGPFKSIEDITNVSGIKEATFDKIRDRICVG